MKEEVTEERDWKELFYWFHRHPEVGFSEYATTEKIKEVLQEEGIELLPAELSTGVIGVIRGQKEGKTICLRADIDALPIEEKTDLAYASQNRGVMHACGHDVHIVLALRTASLLNREKDRLQGTVYFVFQPAEEVAGGAKYILDKRILSDVQEVYGFHVEPTLKPGELSIQSGGVMAAVDAFRITVRGKGTHGATPHLGVSPIPAVVSGVQQTNSILAERMNPLHANVISVTHVEAGNTWNVIPDEALWEGTVRTTDERDREIIKKEIFRIARGLERPEEITTEVDWHDGPAAVVNDEELCKLAEAVAGKHNLKNVFLAPAMVGDDFSEFVSAGEGVKGLYIKVGTGPGENLHSPYFKADISAVAQVAAFLADLLKQTVSETK